MTPHDEPRFPDRRTRAIAWRGLVLGFLAQLSYTFAVTGPAFLIPHLRAQEGYTLAQGGLVGTATSIGMVLTLVAWGALSDRSGERLALVLGLFLNSAATAVGLLLVWADLVHSPYVLALLLSAVGAAGASVNTATGRIVAGWFPRSMRGMAMGVRQMALPLGTAIGAVVVPPLADTWGLPGFFLVALVLCLVSGIACHLGVVDPPRPTGAAVTTPPADDAGLAEAPESPAAPAPGALAAGGRAASADVNPYREDSFLWRIHAVSALLVVPQATFATFGLVWLMDTQGLGAATAGLLVGGAQLLGALARLTMGGVSDWAPSRVLVLRCVAWSAAVLTASVAVVSLGVVPVLAGVLFGLASAASVADNGLAFTSIAEAAGVRWSGKAMGIQNTGQHVLSAVVGPGIGGLISAVGYPIALGAVAVVPVVASFLVPRRDIERI
jgi:MFS family permease